MDQEFLNLKHYTKFNENAEKFLQPKYYYIYLTEKLKIQVGEFPLRLDSSSTLLIVGQNDISNNHSAVLSISHSNMHSNASTFTLERISWVSFPSFSSSSLSIPCTGCLVPASLWHPRAILELKKRAHFCALKSENILKLQNGYRRKLFINVK